MFQVHVLVRADLLGPHTTVLPGCCWCLAVSVPSGFLRGPPIVISLDTPRLSGCKRKSFPGFSFFRAGCIQTLVQIHSDVLILPRVLQQLTMGWIPRFNLRTPFHGDHTSFHAYYWEGSGVKCWGQNICFALLQKNLVSNHYKVFPGVPSLVRVLFHLLLFSHVSDWVFVWFGRMEFLLQVRSFPWASSVVLYRTWACQGFPLSLGGTWLNSCQPLFALPPE